MYGVSVDHEELAVGDDKFKSFDVVAGLSETVLITFSSLAGISGRLRLRERPVLSRKRSGRPGKSKSVVRWPGKSCELTYELH